MESLREISESNFDTTIATERMFTAVFFAAPWHPASIASLTVIQELEGLYKQQVDFFCMNIDENANVPAELGITELPTLIIFRYGHEQCRLVGQHEKRRIQAFLETTLQQ
jgi:thioredoxin 1